MKSTYIPILLAAMLALPLSCARARQEEPKPMDPHAQPKFDVATIKPSDPADRSAGFHTIAQRIFVENQRMIDIVCVAFNVHKTQIVGAPDWFETQRYDIRGSADQPGIPSWRQQQAMLRALLEERLGVRVHHETRDMSRFTIQIAHGGPKLTPTKAVSVDLPDQTGNSSAGKQEWRITNNSMDDVAEFLQGFLDHPVLNQTGLKGKYDFQLVWAKEDAPANADTGGLPGLLTALREQAGLKVEASKGPTDVIVIDHVERPSDN